MRTFSSLITIAITVIGGLITHFTTLSKSKADMRALQEKNQHDIDKLMQQHKLDLDAQERKHEMEKEKLEIEYKHQIDLQKNEIGLSTGQELFSTITKEYLRSSAGQTQMRQARKKRKQ
ncbi:MAG: hypothetical protein LBQ91_02090 [Oscillospiraceae bacterium]|jgi:hypothetical protein|nr:hypothetical protein [Oscillospiraceae bacterium]